MSLGAGTRAAIVGLGRMGLRHLEVLRELGFDVRGASDLRAEARVAAQEQFGLELGVLFEDAAAMLAAARPELLVVATTAPGHHPLVCLGARAGARLILCEKPMARSLAQCDEMIAACARVGAVLAVNHQMRYTEQCLLPKHLAASDALGGLTSMIVKAGNFGLANNGSHYVEMFGFVSGEAPRKVTAWLSPDKVPNPRGPEFEDRGGSLRIETASGKRFYLDAGAEQGHGIATTYLCRHGRIEVDELAGRLQVVSRLPEHRDAPTTRYGMPAETREQEIEPTSSTGPTRSLLEAMLRGEPIPDGAVGRATIEVLVAAQVSHDDGNRAVDLSTEALPRDREFPWA
jgi:predicted dehydrogenase